MVEVICSGYKTCQKDCKCKEPHSCLEPCADIHMGSCWHNEHTDGEYYEHGHVVYKK